MWLLVIAIEIEAVAGITAGQDHETVAVAAGASTIVVAVRTNMMTCCPTRTTFISTIIVIIVRLTIITITTRAIRTVITTSEEIETIVAIIVHRTGITAIVAQIAVVAATIDVVIVLITMAAVGMIDGVAITLMTRFWMNCRAITVLMGK